MIRSMTAFGRGVVETEEGQWTIEIHSVNRKMLDIAIYMPKEWMRFDVDIRKWIAEGISRGQITVRIQPPFVGGGAASLQALQALKQFWTKTAEELSFDPKSISLEFLVAQMRADPQKGGHFEDALIHDSLQTGIQKALNDLQTMKATEGSLLKSDLLDRLRIISEAVERIQSRSVEVGTKHRLRLEEKLREIQLPAGDIQNRILQEVIILVDRSDVTEELVRLRSHLKQFEETLNLSGSVGRKLDFLTQEMHREINTLGSKGVEEEARDIVIVKSEIEKIREQVQNIE